MLSVFQDQPLRVICETNVDIINASIIEITATDGNGFEETYPAQMYNNDPRRVYCDINGGILPATDQMMFRALIYFTDVENPYPGEFKYVEILDLSPPLGIGKPQPGLRLRDYRWALRMYIKDFDRFNRLLNFTAENEVEYIDLYIQMSLGMLNAITPILKEYSLSTFPMPALLIHQATMECLISNNIKFSRNDLTYNNGGVTLKVEDSQRYHGMIQILTRVLDMEMNIYKQLKIAQNIMGAYGGGVASPYAYLHGRYATLQPNSLFAGR